MAQRIVIVGAGLAGANAAVTLRNEGFRGRVVLLGDEPTAPYGRPPLSKTYLRSEEALARWFVKPPDWYEQNDIEYRASTRVQLIDAAAQHVVLGDHETLPYDRLILCTGGRARRMDVPGAQLPGVHLLRTVNDSDAIKRSVRPNATALVVGMGFIGSEVAASLRQLGMNVTAVMSGASPLDRVLGQEVGGVMESIHREHGVDLVANDHVVAFDGSGTLESALTNQGRRIPCDMAVVGVGIDPNTEVAGFADQRNGILVDPRCRTSVHAVYAAGDVANHLHPLFGRVRVEHYNNAEKMGAAAARCVLGSEEPYAYVHSFWSDQYEHTIEYVGHAHEWDQFVTRGDLHARRFVGFYLKDGVVRAAVGLGRGGDPELDAGSEMQIGAQLVALRVPISAEALTDERVPLASLVAGAESSTPQMPT